MRWEERKQIENRRKKQLARDKMNTKKKERNEVKNIKRKIREVTTIAQGYYEASMLFLEKFKMKHDTITHEKADKLKERMMQEVKEYSFQCNSCGRCCMDIISNYVMFNPLDIYLLFASNLEIAKVILSQLYYLSNDKSGDLTSGMILSSKSEYFGHGDDISPLLKSVMENINPSLKENSTESDGQCVFYESTRKMCLIYPLRPNTCRLYPNQQMLDKYVGEMHSVFIPEIDEKGLVFFNMLRSIIYKDIDEEIKCDTECFHKKLDEDTLSNAIDMNFQLAKAVSTMLSFSRQKGNALEKFYFKLLKLLDFYRMLSLWGEERIMKELDLLHKRESNES